MRDTILSVSLIASWALICLFAMAYQEEKALIPRGTPTAAIVTAYSSSVDETDSTPFENASGTRPMDGSIACPGKYAFGTSVIIEGREYVCDDRMAKRYRDKSHFDIYMPSKKKALQWGSKIMIVYVVL